MGACLETRVRKPEAILLRWSATKSPFMVFRQTGDYGPEGERYYVNPDKSQKIASSTMIPSLSGYIDLTGTNWDNIGLVASDLSSYYDFSGGADGSSCSFEMVKKESAGGNVFACDGPWGNWTSNNGTPEITSPGVWKINFGCGDSGDDAAPHAMGGHGSAISSLKAMTYSSETRLWSLDTDLSPGTLKFTTIAVGYGDPIIVYGASEGLSKLSEEGTDIEIGTAGNYTITLNLSQLPYYDYSIKKTDDTYEKNYIIIVFFVLFLPLERVPFWTRRHPETLKPNQPVNPELLRYSPSRL